VNGLTHKFDKNNRHKLDVEKRALEAGLSNIRNIKVDEYDLKLGAQSVGFAILSNVLHEIEDKKRYVSEICRILQNGGKLAIIEWEKIDAELGPPIEHRISYEEVAELLSENGFENILKLSIGQDFYGITAIRK